MANEYVLIIFFFMWYLLISVSFLFVISGLDDLFFDIFYWFRYFKRIRKTRNYEPLTYEKLSSTPEKAIAIMTPCWHEANIIETMLKHNCYAIDYTNYDIFVGVYPNDPDTIKSVQAVADIDSHVHCVIGPTPGPTNKASNLNTIYEYIQNYGKENNIVYEIFVLHDSEDVIHPLSLKLYNHLMPRVDMIQIPVFPLEVSNFEFTHWVYNDEFAESHTKDIIVRESIRGLVPSAGVGTAFARTALESLVISNGGKPFSTATLTEDYSTALQLRSAGLKQVFLTQTVWRTQWRKKYLLFGKYVPHRVKEYVATRELFPTEYSKAVKQKARWITGIAIQEWIHSGWHGDFSTIYTLIHDRKASFTHVINMLGYFIFTFWLFYSIWAFFRPDYPNLQDQLNQQPWAWILIIFCTVSMADRLLQRMIATYRIYGLIPAILSIPRVFYANVINMHALLRAYRQFFLHSKTKTPTRWDKTDHQFPGSHILIPYKRRLGDLLLENRMITQEQLNKIISEQNAGGARFGELLKKYDIVNSDELTALLSEQYHLPIITADRFATLPQSSIPGLSTKLYNWLLQNQCYPINYDADENILLIGFRDPSNEKLIRDIYRKLSAFKIKFGLLHLDINLSPTQLKPDQEKPVK